MKIKNMIIAGAIMLATAVVSVISSEMVWADPPTNSFTGGSTVAITREILNPMAKARTTFTYTVTSVSTSPSGLTAPTIPSGTVAFSGNEDLVSNKFTQYGDISFDVAYPDVGTYTYRITETNPNTAYPVDSSHTYEVIVEVRYPVSADGVPNNGVHSITLLKKKDGSKINTNLLFASEPVYAEVAIETETHGNMARKDVCFPYLVKIFVDAPLVENNDVFEYGVNNNDSLDACSGNSGEITANTPTTVYLKHNEVLTIVLPVGAKYQVAQALDIETGTDQADYSIEIDGAPLDQRSGMNTSLENDTNFDYKTSNATASHADNLVEIVRTKETQIAVGIFTNIWVWVILAVAAIISIILIFRKTTKKEQHLIAE